MPAAGAPVPRPRPAATSLLPVRDQHPGAYPIMPGTRSSELCRCTCTFSPHRRVEPLSTEAAPQVPQASSNPSAIGIKLSSQAQQNAAMTNATIPGALDPVGHRAGREQLLQRQSDRRQHIPAAGPGTSRRGSRTAVRARCCLEPGESPKVRERIPRKLPRSGSR